MMQNNFQRGFCTHPAKKSRIVVAWKCVDIQFPVNLPHEEQTRRRKECQAKDYVGVCSLCRFFEPEKAAAPAAPAAEVPAKPANEPAYTGNKTADDDLDIEF